MWSVISVPGSLHRKLKTNSQLGNMSLSFLKPILAPSISPCEEYLKGRKYTTQGKRRLGWKLRVHGVPCTHYCSKSLGFCFFN